MIHHSHASMVFLVETGIQIMAITPSMWLPGQGSGHGHYQNLSSICHLLSQNDPGGEASLAGPDHSPISGRNGPKESATCLCSKQKSCLCLMLYWDMPCRPDQEVLWLKLTYHVLIYPYCHPVWVWLGTCLDLISTSTW